MEYFISLFIIFSSWSVGSFDWVYDTIECRDYIDLCEVCEFYINDHVDYVTLERWQFSMANKYHNYLYPFNVWKLNPNFYLDFVEMMQEYTKSDHKGMYSLIYSDRFSILWVSKFKGFY